MRDSVTLQVNDERIENFLFYRITSNLFEAADAFELTLADPEKEITEGAQCKLHVNDRLELNGIVDRISEKGSKAGRSLTVEGRDLMGLIVDSYAEDYEEKKDESLEALANRLLAPIKQINRKAIQYGKGSKDRAVPVTDWVADYELTEVEPAQTIFEILKRYATSSGLLFFCMPDGTFVFGKPVTSGTAQFNLINLLDGKQNNVIKWERIRDISKRYSQVTVIGERQGPVGYDLGENYVTATIEDETFPQNLYKPFVANIEQNADSPEKYARVLVEKQQFEGMALSYTTKGHSQDGRNFQVNTVCHVTDDRLRPNVNGDFLIYSRMFSRSREAGTHTELRLSRLGVVPV